MKSLFQIASLVFSQSVQLRIFISQKASMTEQIKKAFESVTQDIKSWTCI